MGHHLVDRYAISIGPCAACAVAAHGPGLGFGPRQCARGAGAVAGATVVKRRRVVKRGENSRSEDAKIIKIWVLNSRSEDAKIIKIWVLYMTYGISPYFVFWL